MPGGLVIGLIGPLGAGKTLFVKGVAGENSPDQSEATSPTFTLVQEYPGRLTIYHLDMYRLERMDDPLLLSLEEMIRPDSVVIIEWADRVQKVLPSDVLWVQIEPRDETSRILSFRSGGPVSKAASDRLRSVCVDIHAAQF